MAYKAKGSVALAFWLKEVSLIYWRGAENSENKSKNLLDPKYHGHDSLDSFGQLLVRAGVLCSLEKKYA